MKNVHRQMQVGFLVMPTALGLQMVAMLLIAVHLGPALFGVFSVIFAIMNVANFVTEMGLGTIITKRVAEGRHSPGHYIGLALPLITVVAATGAVVQMVIVCAAYSFEEAGWAGLIASANIIVFGNSVVLSSTLRGLSEIGKWMAGFFAQKVIAVLAVAALLGPLQGGLATAMGAWTVGNLLILIYYGWCLRNKFRRDELRWRPAQLRSLIGDSIPVGLISAANQLSMYLDTFILAALVPNRDVGLYALGQRLLNPARNVLHGAVGTPTFPGLCRVALEDQEEFARQTVRLCVTQWVCALPLVVLAWVAAPLVLPRLLAEFDESVRVIWITVWALAPACLTLQYRYVYIALSQQRRFLLLNVAYLALKCVLLVGVTLRYGIWGACYGTVAAELGFAVLVHGGALSMGVRARLGLRLAVPTLATALVVTVLWAIGLERWPAILLAGFYLAVTAVVANRLLRGLRRKRQAGASQEVAAAPDPPIV